MSNCRFAPCPYYAGLERLEKLPTKTELKGHYTLNIEPLSSVGPAELILYENNLFKLKNIPIGVLDVFYSDYKQGQNSLQDITGKWKISNSDNNYELNVSIDYKKIDSQLGIVSSNWELYYQDKKPVILIILGDPDSCEALSFIKNENTVGNNGYNQCSVHPPIGKVKNKVET